MILGASVLAQIAFGGIAGAGGLSHVELSASIAIQSLVNSGISIGGFEHVVGESVFASHGMADEAKSFIFASNNKRSTLLTAIDTDDLSITLTGDISSWPTSGALTLDLASGATDTSNEIVYYDGKAGQSITLVGRGKDGTTAKSFAAGSRVRISPIAETHNLLARTLIDVEETVLAHDAELETVLAGIAGLESEIDAKLPLAGGTMSGLLTLSGIPTADLHAATKAYVDASSSESSGGTGVYNAKLYGLVGNGTTDDTAALQALINLITPLGGGRIYFPPGGKYIIGGPLQETSGRNAQILLPIVPTAQPPVTIEFVGALAPPRQFYMDTPLPSASAYSTIKSTLTGGTGSASFIAGAIAGGGNYWDNVQLVVRDLIFEAPPNPSFTAFNCLSLMGPQFERVLIHTGTLQGLSITEPTNSNSFGIRLAPSGQSAGQSINLCDIWGFYHGMSDGELAQSDINIWLCKIGVLVPFNNHLSTFRHLGLMGCQRGIYAVGPHYLRVFACAIETGTVATGSALAWQERIYDVDDVNNYLKGDLKWLSVAATIGNDHTFIKNGGTGFLTSEIGT